MFTAGAGVVHAEGSEPTAALPEITVSSSGLALGVSDMTTPVSVIEGDTLVRSRAATLGETLEGEPGITSSHFGAGASRPVIRGMDGPRVKVLSDGSEIQDASTISPDHAVASEPMLATQIEVLRGPSALIYGAGAVGGVVNVLDNKIPTAIPEKGVEGSAEVRYGSGANEKAGAVSLTGGAGNIAAHVEISGRNAGDYDIGNGWSGGASVPGSFNRTSGGSLGLSWIGSQGYLGFSVTQQNAKYGLPGHNHDIEGCHPHGDHLHCGSHDGHEHEHEEHAAGDVPVVDMRSNRLDVRGELRNPFAGFSVIRMRGGLTDYRHDEIEDGAIGTTFKNKAYDLRVEAEHQPIAGWKGVLGVQTSQRKFSAVGEEAYVQPTLTRKTGLFLLEEYRIDNWRFEAALRHDRQTAEAEDSQIERSHNGTSLSLGTVWRFQPGYAAGLTYSRASRAPTAEELYARGLHMATATYEIGNTDLRNEVSNNFDLSLRKTSGPTTFDVTAYRNRIKGYIYGQTLDAQEGVQLLQYSQRDATFTGVEAKVRQQLHKALGLTVFGDVVRAKLDDGSNLPRMAPARLGVRLDTQWREWDGNVEWVQVARQSRVAEFESQTPGYGMLNVGVAYNGGRGTQHEWQVYLKARNLTNRLAYSATSFIKDAAPLMGRNVVLGMRVSF
ncbi:TonB-dependent receptor domain-containing protein [Diaphorobacter sp. HDW4A]|uniref:TonB-dependent receptor domain-containing protein n=1 Tax=Diaphorobacter sp. HDW4A TaxID=2714924 RepID=UPI001F10EB62|nr:TonB-dependent receptor [Diaphorobacter sp. HDW4A]